MPGEINPVFRSLPVAVNLFYGDPMLQARHTVGMLKKLEKSGHTGPVIVITKGDFSKFPAGEFNLDVHFAFSTFGKNHYLDGGSRKIFLKNLALSEKRPGFKYSVEFRPIAFGINDTNEVFNFVMSAASDYGMSVGYSGLQGKPAIVKIWVEEDSPLRPYPGYRFGHKKMIAPDVEKKLLDAACKYRVAVFRKTSCLISFVHGLKRDYNSHYYRPNEVGCSGCVMEKTCFSFYDSITKDSVPEGVIPFKYEVVYKENHVCILKRKGICEFPTEDCSRIKGYLIKIDDKITTSDVRVIKWLTGLTVDADFIEMPYISRAWARN
jgi:hypothetical protein